MKERKEREEHAREEQREGKMDKVKGHAKESWGEITDDPSREHEGRRDRLRGEIKEERGELEEQESRLDERR